MSKEKQHIQVKTIKIPTESNFQFTSTVKGLTNLFK